MLKANESAVGATGKGKAEKSRNGISSGNGLAITAAIEINAVKPHAVNRQIIFSLAIGTTSGKINAMAVGQGADDPSPGGNG